MADIISVLVNRRRHEISEVEHDAKEMLQKWGSKKGAFHNEEEYMIFLPKTGMNLKEINRDICKAKQIIKIASTISRARRVTESAWNREIWNALERGVKLKHIVETPSPRNPLPELLQLISSHPNFTLYYTRKPVESPIVIHDDRKVWITASDERGYVDASSLVSNNRHLVKIAIEHFRLILDNVVVAPKNEKLYTNAKDQLFLACQ